MLVRHSVQVVYPVSLILLLVPDQQRLAHLGLLPRLVVLVEPLEVGGDDGDGEREHQHPRHRAHAAEQLAQARPAIDIGLLVQNGEGASCQLFRMLYIVDVVGILFSRGRDVPVADCGHGHHHPVDPSGY